MPDEYPYKERFRKQEEKKEAFYSGNTLEFEAEEVEFGTFSPATSPNISLFHAQFEAESGSIFVEPVSIQKHSSQITIEKLSESEDGGWGQQSSIEEKHEMLPESAIGYAVYVHYDTISSWETWLACLGSEYSEALGIAAWLAFGSENSALEVIHEFVTGVSPDPQIREREQDDALDFLGRMSETCAVTGESDNLQEITLPYYTLPYLGERENQSIYLPSDIPRFPFTLPQLKTRVSEEIAAEYEIQSSYKIKRREAGVYVVNEDMRNLAEQIDMADVDIDYSRWM